MVTFSLVRVRLGERRNRAIKLVASPQIAADDRRIARAGMRASQRPPAESRVQNKVPLRELFNIRGLFPVPQLANRAVNGPAVGPSQKDVASGLHQMLPVDHPLGLIGIGASTTLLVSVIQWRHEQDPSAESLT